MIRIENLKKRYKKIDALNSVSLHVKAGELFAYLGPNGAGKTTTIQILTGLTALTSGDAWLNGFHIEKQSIKAKTQCGIVPQSINLDQELSVFENLDIHGRLFHMRKKDRVSKIDTMLEYVDMGDRRSSPVKQLSGGMKRRVMIARAMVHSPKILFLDEPTVGLDAKIRRRIWALIKKIQQEGTTIFLTTHHIEEAEFLAQRTAFLDEGKIVAVDSPEKLMQQIGSWAIDKVMNDQMETLYFKTREEARQYAGENRENIPFTLRRVNLEDAFLEMTGKKVS